MILSFSIFQLTRRSCGVAVDKLRHRLLRRPAVGTDAPQYEWFYTVPQKLSKNLCNLSNRPGFNHQDYRAEMTFYHMFKIVVSIGRLTAFLVPMELIPSKPPHGTYVIVSFCTLQKGSNF